MRLRLMLVIMVIALVLTRSRGGNAGFLIALSLVMLPFLMASGRMRVKGLLLVASILVIDLLVIGKFVGVDRVIERLNQTPIYSAPNDLAAAGSGVNSAVNSAKNSTDSAAANSKSVGFSEESLEGRSGPAAQALAMFADRPLHGFGAGSFYTVFPTYAGPEFSRYYDHVHNDYIQLLVESGLIGFGLLGLVVAFTVARAIAVILRPARSLDLGLALGALLVIVGVGAQAAGDFHFQIPANALTFVMVLAMVWVLRLEAKDIKR
jgi:O-antigen ligase